MSPTTSQTKTVLIDNIPYSTFLSGPTNAPVILLTHALMSNSHMWDSLLPALHAANYRTLAFDHIGHNSTPAPQSPAPHNYSTEDIVHHMYHIVLSTTGQDHLAAVIGCSIGGVLALRYAMLYPALTVHCISLCAPGVTSIAASKPLWSARITQFEQDLRTGEETLCRETVARWLPGDESWDAEVREQALEHVRACTLEGYRILADAIRGYDYAGELGRLRGVRCLVVAGGRDGAVRVELLEGIAEEISARFVVMGDAGHIPPMHRPEEFRRLVVEFMASG